MLGLCIDICMPLNKYAYVIRCLRIVSSGFCLPDNVEYSAPKSRVTVTQLLGYKVH